MKMFRPWLAAFFIVLTKWTLGAGLGIAGGRADGGYREEWDWRRRLQKFVDARGQELSTVGSVSWRMVGERGHMSPATAEHQPHARVNLGSGSRPAN
jgi:hypothetical protein